MSDWRVAICIATCVRTAGLLGLLSSLSRLELPEVSSLDVRVVVVDNHPAGDSVLKEDELGRLAGWPVEVARETRRGIPHARNRALQMILHDVDFVAFVDDDEEVSPGWLANLLAVADEHQADVVAGPVLPRYSQDVPTWLEQGGFHNRRRRATGTEIAFCATNNALVRADTMRELDRWFDDRFTLTGGSDTELFLRLSEAGARIVWADAATVWEDVPNGRVSVQWTLKREIRGGANFGYATRLHHGLRARVTALRALRAVGRIVGGTAGALLTLPIGRHLSLRGLRKAAVGFGTLYGMSGKQPIAYEGNDNRDT